VISSRRVARGVVVLEATRRRRLVVLLDSSSSRLVVRGVGRQPKHNDWPNDLKMMTA